MKNFNVEIAAPVGSFEGLMAAIQGGADSIYFGIDSLNLRSASSFNFKLSDIKKISKICNNHGIKNYLTLNSIIYDEEIKKAKKIIDYSKDFINGIIVSDCSLLEYLKNLSLPVHLSTQLNISNLESLKFFSQYCDVIVLARELSLKQISFISRQIKKHNIKGKSGNIIKLEVFIHGALCMSFSGKCFLSEHTHGKSANRGECLQNCRRPYSIIDDQNNIFKLDNPYILSAKDLSTLSILDKIVKTSVSILKIEGRGRSPEYVKTVVSTYNKALSLINNNSFDRISIQKLNEDLSSVYNRGYWTGHYLSEFVSDWNTDVSGSKSKVIKEYIGDVTNYFRKNSVVEIFVNNSQIVNNDKLLIIGNKTGVVELKIAEIWFENSIILKAEKGNKITLKCNEIVRKNDKVYKIVSRN
ncbi:MAG: U32 family peptidase [Sphingobacteriales bacterium]|nr:U32 family peptidase [Sphingobacteriales bacterium]